MNEFTWMKKDTDVKRIYSLEYIDNKKDFDAAATGDCINGIEPWERYKTIEYNNASQAMIAYVVRKYNPYIYDVKLFETIYVNGEQVAETWIEIDSTAEYILKSFVNKSMVNRNLKLSETIDIYKSEVEVYKKFIDSNPMIGKWFDNFKKEQNI